MQQKPSSMKVAKPSAHVAAAQSPEDEPVHNVQEPVCTDGSDAKSLQQKPSPMKFAKPAAHVAVTQFAEDELVHGVHDPFCTEGSEEKSGQHIPSTKFVHCRMRIAWMT